MNVKNERATTGTFKEHTSPEDVTCPDCHGRGYLDVSCYIENEVVHDTRECEFCDGTGTLIIIGDYEVTLTSVDRIRDVYRTLCLGPDTHARRSNLILELVKLLGNDQ